MEGNSTTGPDEAQTEGAQQAHHSHQQPQQLPEPSVVSPAPVPPVPSGPAVLAIPDGDLQGGPAPDSTPVATDAPTAGPSMPAPRPRSIKTPLQKEALEAAYLVNKFPDEDVRRMLGDRIGLKEQQIQVWFSHKRRKEKKEQEDAAIRASVEQKLANEKASEQSGGSKSMSGAVPMELDAPQSSMPPPAPHIAPPAGSVPAASNATAQSIAASSPAAPRPQLPLPTSNLASVPAPMVVAPPAPAAAVNAPAVPGMSQPEVGPPASTSIFSESVQRTVDLAKQPARQLTPEERADIPELLALARKLMPVPFREDGPPLVFEFDDPPLIGPDGTCADDEPTLKRKRVDGDDDDIARHRRPSAGAKGASRTEMERLERERRRAEERAERDRRKQEAARTKEELRLRVLQEREEKKLQAQAEKDRKAQERKEKLHERRKEKEMLKALQAQEKQATRLRQRDVGTGPKDDLDIEWETLIAAQQEAGYTSGTEGETKADPPPLVRPEFPPPSLAFTRLLPHELPDAAGGDLLFIWSFLRSFGDLLGLTTLTVDQLLQSLVDGSRSRVLAEVHIAMLRIVQADMEEAHATGAMQSGSAINFLDRAIVSCAAMLEEAWAWGFDVDAWRAHLNALTWPEVLRQIAIVWGLGPKRPKPKKEVKPKMGTDGEDVIIDESGGLKLRLPVRFGVGTVKAAAWQVLAEAGPSGLMISEIARRIQQSGLRDLRTSKTPEASVAGALSRDVIFARIAPATYALQAVVNYHNKLLRGDDAGTGANGIAKSPSPADKSKAKEDEQPAVAAANAADLQIGDKASEEQEKKSEERDEEEENEGESSGDEEEAPEEQQVLGEAWVEALKHNNYSDMDLLQRITILAALVHLTIDGPTVRNTLEARLEEAVRVRKQMWEEAKLEKKKKQEEAAAKAKAAAAEAQRVIEIMKTKEGSAAPAQGPEGPTPAPPSSVPAASPGAPNGNGTPVPPSSQHTPEPEVEVKSEPNAADLEPSRDPSMPLAGKENGAQVMDTVTKATPGPSIERAHSGVAPSEGGISRKAEGEDDISAAAAAKQRHLQRAETIRKAEEANAIRGEPLGLDRRYNKYWRFADMDSAQDDPFAGRLVMESQEDGSYRMLGSVKDLDGLIAALDKRGAREGMLYNALLSYRDAIVQAMPAEPMKMPADRTDESREQLFEEHSEWVSSVSCVAASRVRGKLPHADADEPHLAKLKRDLLAVEKALPRDALRAEWDASTWRASAKNAGEPLEVRRALAELEDSLQEGWASLAFRKDPLLVRGAWFLTGREVASALPGNNGEIQQLLPAKEGEPAALTDEAPQGWLPPTVAALSLRLQALDASLQYAANASPAREELLAYKYTQRPVVLARRAGADACRESGASEIVAPLCGQAILLGGRALPTLTPPFPLALLTGEQQTFSMNWAKLKKEIADEKAGILPPPVIPPRQSLQPATEKAGRNMRSKASKANGKGSKAAKGKGSKAGKAKAKQSALREEFDRQSEEEEAAERRGFSTPGFSDDDSDFEQYRGRKFKLEDEEMEISD